MASSVLVLLLLLALGSAKSATLLVATGGYDDPCFGVVEDYASVYLTRLAGITGPGCVDHHRVRREVRPRRWALRNYLHVESLPTYNETQQEFVDRWMEELEVGEKFVRDGGDLKEVGVSSINEAARQLGVTLDVLFGTDSDLIELYYPEEASHHQVLRDLCTRMHGALLWCSDYNCLGRAICKEWRVKGSDAWPFYKLDSLSGPEIRAMSVAERREAYMMH
jgi:hypothetical protein